MSEQILMDAPFGSNVVRFSTKLHAATNEKLGPGCYDINDGDFSAKSVTKRASGPGWARGYETSHMIALPYLLNKEEWERKKELPRKLGPGSYNFRDSLDAPREKQYSRGLLAMNESRFKADKSMVTPGPGNYGKGGVPQAVIEEKAHQSFGTIELLACGGNGLRNLSSMGSNLGPGTYNISSSVDELVKKKTGTRGPYEVFTVDRSKPVLTGHFATSVTYNLGPGQYDMKSSINEVLDNNCGKFGKAAQYPQHPIDRIIVSSLALKPRVSTEPGPDQYDPKDQYAKPLSQAVKSPPFMSSCARADKIATKFFTGNYNPVGPGRYDIQKRDIAQDTYGCQSAFKSKTERPTGIRLRVLSERLAAKNLPFPRDQLLLVHHSEPRCYKGCERSLSMA